MSEREIRKSSKYDASKQLFRRNRTVEECIAQIEYNSCLLPIRPLGMCFLELQSNGSLLEHT